MRIAHVVRQYRPAQGGLEEFVERLAAEQLRAGHDVRVLTCDRDFQAKASALQGTELVDGVDVRRFGYAGSSRYPVAPSVLKHLSGRDIVHVHGIDFFFDFLAATKLFHRKALVATTHGGFFHTARNRLIKRIWFRTMTGLSSRRYDRIVACSQTDYESFAHVVETQRLTRIDNGVDIEKFAGAAAGMSKTLVTIGRFSVNKRIDRLLDTMVHLVRADPVWSLDICGLPSDLSAGDVRQQVVRRDLKDRVRIHDKPTVDELRRLIGRSTIFVSASEYEGFGMALIEAMSAGLIPVVHRNAAFTWLAAEHDVIRLADFGNPGSAAREIGAAWQALSDNAGLRERAKAAVSRYSWPEVAQRYEEVYEQVTGRRNVQQRPVAARA